MTSEDPLSEVG